MRKLSAAQKRILLEADGKEHGLARLYRSEVRTGYKLQDLGLGRVQGSYSNRVFAINDVGRERAAKER